MTTDIYNIFPDDINNIIFGYSYTKPLYIYELKKVLKNIKLSKEIDFDESLKDISNVWCVIS